MSNLFRLIWCAVVGLFRSRSALQAEILALRHQLNVLRRRSPKRVTVSNIDRLVFAGLYRLAPEVLDAMKIIKPETVIRWPTPSRRSALIRPIPRRTTAAHPQSLVRRRAA